MGRNINNGKLSKQYILDKVSQITIFSVYLNLSNNIIQNCINNAELICSPLREDVHPTCGFRYDNRGKLKFRDFNGAFWGDCFDVVAYIMSDMYNKQYTVNDKEDFIKILRHITFTFKDIFYGQERDINMINSISASVENIKHKKPIIEVVVRQWNKQDIEYWGNKHVDIGFLNTHFVYPVDQYYINRNINPEPKYYYDNNDPCYAYNLGRDRNGIYSMKLYFPYRSKQCTRFITNCNHLEGIYNLERKDYDIIVITKSTKDRICIGRFTEYLYGQDTIVKIGCINLPHETYRLRQNEYDWLSSKLNPNGIIVSLMDNDRTGMNEAIWLRDNYNIKPLLFPKAWKIKDFAEYVEKRNTKEVYGTISRCVKWCLDAEEKAKHKRNGKQSQRNAETSDSLPY